MRKSTLWICLITMAMLLQCLMPVSVLAEDQTVPEPTQTSGTQEGTQVTEKTNAPSEDEASGETTAAGEKSSTGAASGAETPADKSSEVTSETTAPSETPAPGTPEETTAPSETPAPGTAEETTAPSETPAAGTSEETTAPSETPAAGTPEETTAPSETPAAGTGTAEETTAPSETPAAGTAEETTASDPTQTSGTAEQTTDPSESQQAQPEAAADGSEVPDPEAAAPAMLASAKSMSFVSSLRNARDGVASAVEKISINTREEFLNLLPESTSEDGYVLENKEITLSNNIELTSDDYVKGNKTITLLNSCLIGNGHTITIAAKVANDVILPLFQKIVVNANNKLESSKDNSGYINAVKDINLVYKGNVEGSAFAAESIEGNADAKLSISGVNVTVNGDITSKDKGDRLESYGFAESMGSSLIQDTSLHVTGNIGSDNIPTGDKGALSVGFVKGSTNSGDSELKGVTVTVDQSIQAAAKNKAATAAGLGEELGKFDLDAVSILVKGDIKAKAEGDADKKLNVANTAAGVAVSLNRLTNSVIHVLGSIKTEAKGFYLGKQTAAGFGVDNKGAANTKDFLLENNKLTVDKNIEVTATGDKTYSDVAAVAGFDNQAAKKADVYWTKLKFDPNKEGLNRFKKINGNTIEVKGSVKAHHEGNGWAEARTFGNFAGENNTVKINAFDVFSKFSNGTMAGFAQNYLCGKDNSIEVNTILLKAKKTAEASVFAEYLVSSESDKATVHEITLNVGVDKEAENSYADALVRGFAKRIEDVEAFANKHIDKSVNLNKQAPTVQKAVVTLGNVMVEAAVRSRFMGFLEFWLNQRLTMPTETTLDVGTVSDNKVSVDSISVNASKSSFISGFGGNTDFNNKKIEKKGQMENNVVTIGKLRSTVTEAATNDFKDYNRFGGFFNEFRELVMRGNSINVKDAKLDGKVNSRFGGFGYAMYDTHDVSNNNTLIEKLDITSPYNETAGFVFSAQKSKITDNKAVMNEVSLKGPGLFGGFAVQLISPLLMNNEAVVKHLTAVNNADNADFYASGFAGMVMAQLRRTDGKDAALEQCISTVGEVLLSSGGSGSMSYAGFVIGAVNPLPLYFKNNTANTQKLSITGQGKGDGGAAGFSAYVANSDFSGNAAFITDSVDIKNVANAGFGGFFENNVNNNAKLNAAQVGGPIHVEASDKALVGGFAAFIGSAKNQAENSLLRNTALLLDHIFVTAKKGSVGAFAGDVKAESGQPALKIEQCAAYYGGDVIAPKALYVGGLVGSSLNAVYDDCTYLVHADKDKDGKVEPFIADFGGLSPAEMKALVLKPYIVIVSADNEKEIRTAYPLTLNDRGEWQRGEKYGEVFIAFRPYQKQYWGSEAGEGFDKKAAAATAYYLKGAEVEGFGPFAHPGLEAAPATLAVKDFFNRHYALIGKNSPVYDIFGISARDYVPYTPETEPAPAPERHYLNDDAKGILFNNNTYAGQELAGNAVNSRANAGDAAANALAAKAAKALPKTSAAAPQGDDTSMLLILAYALAASCVLVMRKK